MNVWIVVYPARVVTPAHKSQSLQAQPIVLFRINYRIRFVFELCLVNMWSIKTIYQQRVATVYIYFFKRSVFLGDHNIKFTLAYISNGGRRLLCDR